MCVFPKTITKFIKKGAADHYSNMFLVGLFVTILFDGYLVL